MKILECLHTESKCYKAAQAAHPVGIVVHSTGVNNPWLSRYVQPSKNDPDREELLSLIGKNKYGNSWNRNVKKSTHYMVGKRNDGTVGVAHILPEEFCAWGVGNGKKGSYNYNPTAHIQFEVCEDNLKDAAYFKDCYNAAVSLCADICRRWGWDESVIVSHKEAHALGYASNHGDIDHWLKKFGMTMDDFRADVRELLRPGETETTGGAGNETGGSGTDTNSGETGADSPSGGGSTGGNNTAGNSPTDEGDGTGGGKPGNGETVGGSPSRIFAVGETVNFVGNTHYTNANAKTGKACKPGKAVLMQIYRLGKSKHPYLVKGKTVYGWVDEGDVR